MLVKIKSHAGDFFFETHVKQKFITLVPALGEQVFTTHLVYVLENGCAPRCSHNLNVSLRFIINRRSQWNARRD